MSLHGQIMNLRFEKYPPNLNRDEIFMAYRMGYRDARHDAAELALRADAVADVLRDMVAMIDANDEHGSGSEWHKQAVKALSDLEKP